MNSAEIRRSFLDFFREKQHTIVPSSSLLPDAPNLLFTNAGMNQFVPIFLGQQKPQWNPPRVADTQKCIRAGGKHNDLEDVGLDTYHHTFFEMLGNWSFGDYFNQEAYEHWAHLFREADLDPKIHVLSSGKADNFWMMGDTGPCGPCSEVHVDLTPDGDTRGELVNKEDPRCIEIWNLVFIQFNANADGSFTPLPQRHVDTGMGFERVTAIIQGTKNLTDFSGTISNYETDIFRPIFDELEKLSGKKYGSTIPKEKSAGENDEEKIDVAFRVIADHVRALSFAIADGIIPSNEGRGYVLRRILRRAVRYGRTLEFHEPFFFKLVDVVAKTMGDVFPEVRAKQSKIKETIKREEEAFNKTLDIGIELFDEIVEAHEAFKQSVAEMEPHMLALENAMHGARGGEDFGECLKAIEVEVGAISQAAVPLRRFKTEGLPEEFKELQTAPPNVEGAVAALVAEPIMVAERRHEFLDMAESEINGLINAVDNVSRMGSKFSGESAFVLYDTYGFPLDLTELMARERGLTLDVARFERLMDEQRERARRAQKKEQISIEEGGD